jgi:N-acetylglucosaminyl-diphospho-decaprenol L-rhamnosyltransferase
MTRVSVVIVNYRTPELTRACLASLMRERNSIAGLRVVVVDGGSADGSAELLGSVIAGADLRDWVELLPLPINGGFGWANNQAIGRLIAGPEPPDYIHLLNPDAEIEPGAIKFLVDYLDDHPATAAVGSQLLEPDGSWTGSAFSFPTLRGEFSRGARTGALDRLLRVPPVATTSATASEVDWATGASVMFRVAALRQTGLFDEGFFLYHEEIELMWRMRKAGWAVAFEPRSRVRHVGGAATGVHSRPTIRPLEPRKPHYWYRSRSRYFGLTRGRAAATSAFFSWLLGHAVWRLRWAAGLAPDAKPFDHQLRDHVANAFPRKHDLKHAPAPANDPPTDHPAWMEHRWI